MKKLISAAALAALLATVSLTSCFSDDESGYVTFGSYVTVKGSETEGYVFYADDGFTLIPTASSVASALTGFANINPERAYITFQLVDQEEGYMELLPDHVYNINVVPSINNVSLPTYDIIDFYHNEQADTLVTNQDKVSAVDDAAWVANGYVNLGITVAYEPSVPCYVNMAYDSQVDIDKTNNKLTFTLYFDNNTDNAYQTGNALFCFRIPPYAYEALPNEEVTIEVKALTRGATEANVVDIIKCNRSDLRRNF